jgi:hypothetical protein
MLMFRGFTYVIIIYHLLYFATGDFLLYEISSDHQFVYDNGTYY